MRLQFETQTTRRGLSAAPGCHRQARVAWRVKPDYDALETRASSVSSLVNCAAIAREIANQTLTAGTPVRLALTTDALGR